MKQKGNGKGNEMCRMITGIKNGEYHMENTNRKMLLAQKRKNKERSSY